MFDGGGLYLEVAPSGGKWWRWKYRVAGKEKRLSLGVYPEISLAKAREARDECRKLLARGIDPAEQRKAMKTAGEDRAIRLAPLVFVRPGELRQAKWEFINLEDAEWLLKLSKRRDGQRAVPGIDDWLIVPLSDQAVAILQEMHSLSGKGEYVFPGNGYDDRCISDNAINMALRRMGIPKEEMCGHGFRATARTILAEKLMVRQDFIEHQLGHQVIDPNGRAYNRTTFLPERRLMMQAWADYLDKLKSGKPVAPTKQKRLTDIRAIQVNAFV
jgi:integrase